MGISINLQGRGRGRRWRIDLSSPPVVAHKAGSRLGATFLILFALFWGGAPAVGLYSTVRSGDIGPEIAILLIFPIFGVAIFLFGIHNWLWRRSVTYDGHAFTVTERGLRGEKSWTEPLSAYDGVMRSTRRVKTRNSSYTLYMVDLVHPDSDRKINLYTDTSETGFRGIWESYARQLRLPAFDQGEGGMVRREAADLDKSVGELIAEGKIDIDYDALARPASGLAFDIEGDTIVITRTGPQNSWPASLMAVLFPLIFVGVGFFAPGLDLVGRVIFGGMGLLFELLFAIGVYKDLTTRERLRVGPDGLRASRAGPRGESERKHIPDDEIEAITVKRKENRWRPAVEISGDRETLRFGRGLPRNSLDFVMHTILAKIAETGRR